ncbi:unnamed protein product [Caenorhabditis auriculariae]|uniref:Uncharacterized protein n=1 Tax=Caenorhabditis auriculariae TaxID=2777116 RepID=A0A8S1HXX4_9PELO|nr:unnamed protein product [Caenorhabditis auriculariae]
MENARQKPAGKLLESIRQELDSVEKYIEDEEVLEMLHKKAENMTDDEKMMQVPIKLIRQAAKIGLTMSGKNASELEGKSIRMISPRIMGIMPEEENDKEINIFSPSLFSLHDEGKGVEKATSLSRILKGSNFGDADSQQLIDLIVEATGVSEAVEDAEKKLEETDRKRDESMGLRGPDGQPLFFTKENMTRISPKEAKKIELIEKLEKMYTAEQMKEMNTTGYAILTPAQRLHVYGPQSPHYNPKLLKTSGNMTNAQIRRLMHQTIKDVAAGKTKFEVRRNDIVLSPVVNTALIFDPVFASQSIVLSPVLLTPLIGSPAIFGNVILSPWVFVPIIISPRLLSPVILSPFVMSPVILSPLVLDPAVLSPGVMNPFVLSPLLLTPFILSPQVMTPIILSPFALTPLILNPMLLSPLVLSPFVLSPSILSPQFVTALVLSPYALSPSVESKGALITVVASPSWLS